MKAEDNKTDKKNFSRALTKYHDALNAGKNRKEKSKNDPVEQNSKLVHVISINCGGLEYLASNNIKYVTDQHYERGRTRLFDNEVENTEDDTLFQSTRYGNFQYKIPVEKGNYRVTLRFADSHHTKEGKRLFDIFVQGESVVSNLDLFKTYGRRKAGAQAFDAKVDGEYLKIKLKRIKDNAVICAIDVYRINE